MTKNTILKQCMTNKMSSQEALIMVRKTMDEWQKHYHQVETRTMTHPGDYSWQQLKKKFNTP